MHIGRYKVCGLLGRGGMGAVYKVRQPHTGRMAALKLLRPTEELAMLVAEDELRRRFVREAEVMAALDHPHIAAVWDVDEDDRGRPFFVMEYYCLNLGLLMGESYRVEAPTRRLPLERAVNIATQTLDALHRMHHAGVVHRDVKPFNIMIDREGNAKLIDFGLSRLRGERAAGMRGVKVGSPYYAPPEQERAPESVDGRADIYPVGVMLYRMLTGVLPTDEALMQGGCIPRVSDYAEDLDEAWDTFFDTALAAAPENRFPSARAMREELQRLTVKWRNHITAVCHLEVDPPTCSLPDDPPTASAALAGEASTDFLAGAEGAAPSAAGHPRLVPVKVGPRHAPHVFGLDALWRPRNVLRCALEATQHPTVMHPVTGCMWQRSGSEFPLDWEEAHAYVRELNAERFAGYGDWRLPTVADVCTLLQEPPTLGVHCVAPVFDTGADPLWTCDRRSFMAAWFVSTSMGFVGWQDMTCRFHVRVVRNT